MSTPTTSAPLASRELDLRDLRSSSDGVTTSEQGVRDSEGGVEGGEQETQALQPKKTIHQTPSHGQRTNHEHTHTHTHMHTHAHTHAHTPVHEHTHMDPHDNALYVIIEGEHTGLSQILTAPPKGAAAEGGGGGGSRPRVAASRPGFGAPRGN